MDYVNNIRNHNINNLIDHPINSNSNNEFNNNIYLIINDLLSNSEPNQVFHAIIKYLAIEKSQRYILERHLLNYLKNKSNFNILIGLLKNNSSSQENLINTLLILLAFTRRDKNLNSIIKNIDYLSENTDIFLHYEKLLKNYTIHINNLKKTMIELENKLTEKRIELSNVGEKLDKDLSLLENADKCPICLDGIKNYIIVPCGHKCLCEECSKLIKNNNRDCPICNNKVENIYKVFES